MSLIRAIQVITLIACTSVHAQSRNYYVSSSGNDDDDGQTPATAWLTLKKVNLADLNPGDTVYLQGGDSFPGILQLSSEDNGTINRPVVITSLGKAKATINAGDGEGVRAINCSNIRLISIMVKGSGVDMNNGSGIHFYSNDSTQAPSNIHIVNCDVSGFHNSGILFGAHENPSVYGYHNVHITHCNATGNGNAGISSYGSQQAYQHSDFYIAYCRAYRNAGIRSKKDSHSGNGIVMAQVKELLIEHCEAFENGKDNQSTAGGPVGIWVWMCKNAIIQNCVSHHNYAGFTKDGGGFDIDGGSSDCILQNNYSYNNEGAGYLLAEFGALFPFNNNIIRFNVSINDGRKNGYGSITIWGAAPEFSLTNSIVHNNTIYLDDQQLVDGVPAVVNFIGKNFKNVLVANNIFITKGAVKMITSDTSFDASEARMTNNVYHSLNGQYIIEWNKKHYRSLHDWLMTATEQEQLNGKTTAFTSDPLFANKKALSILSSKDLSFVPTDLFALQEHSPLRKKKFELNYPLFFYSGLKDYCNQMIGDTNSLMPGACVK